jgi:hypothetical protein
MGWRGQSKKRAEIPGLKGFLKDGPAASRIAAGGGVGGCGGNRRSADADAARLLFLVSSVQRLRVNYVGRLLGETDDAYLNVDFF